MEKITLHQCKRAAAMTFVLQYSQRHTLLCRPHQQGPVLSLPREKPHCLSSRMKVNIHRNCRTFSTRGSVIQDAKLSSSNTDGKRQFLKMKCNVVSDSMASALKHPTAPQLWNIMSKTVLFMENRLFSSVPLNYRCLGNSRYFSTKDTVSQSQPDSLKEEELDKESSPLDITSLTHAVIAAGSKVDKMLLSLPQKRVEAVVHTLVTEGMSMVQVKDLLLEKPGLLIHNKLKQVLSLLKTYNLSTSDVFKVLKGVQNLSDLKHNQIENVLEVLRAAGMTDGNLQEMIISEPGIFSLDGKSIQDRISKLKMFFKTEDVLRVIRKAPVVLIHDWRKIEENFMYVSQEMNISQRQIMYSHLFLYPLEHVKCRHLFLVRAGLFRMEQYAKSNNPRLQDIIDTSDPDFVRRFGGMDVDEYRTFYKLMMKSEHSEETV